MTLSDLSVTAIALGVAIGIAGCGGAEEQDVGTPTEPTTFAGRGLDGYLANSLVWLDLKENSRIDSFEPFAYTDAQGFFSYNPITGTDYCAQQASGVASFCLQTSSNTDRVNIKLTGGTDVLTGQGFEGTLTVQVDTDIANERYQQLKVLGVAPGADSAAWPDEFNQQLTLITPLTTLKEKLPADSELSTILLNMGVAVPGGFNDETILQTDFFAHLNDEPDFAADLFTAAVNLQKFSDAMVVYLDQIAKPIGLGEDNLPASSADAVWGAIAQWLIAHPGSTLADGANQITTNAVATLIAQVDAVTEPPPTVISTLQSEALARRITTSSAAMVRVNNALFYQAESRAHYLAAVKGQELLLQAVKRQSAGEASLDQVTTIANYLTSEDNALITALGSREVARENDDAVSEVDLQLVSDNLLRLAQQSQTLNIDAEALLSGATLAPVDTQAPASFWPGKRLSLSGVIDDGDRAQAKLFFKKDNNPGLNGELVMCISYLATQPQDNIVGQRFAGTWSVYDEDNPNQLSLIAEGYSLQMKILGEVSGSEIDVEVGTSPQPNLYYGKFRFVLNDDSEIWYSDDPSLAGDFGIKQYDEIPEDDSACRATLVPLD